MHFVTSGDFPGIRAAHARGLVPRPCTDLGAPVNSLRRLIRIIANVRCMRSSKQSGLADLTSQIWTMQVLL